MCTPKWVIVAVGAAAAVVIIMCMSIYFSSNGSNQIDMGPGDDTSMVKESNGFHILEVDASNDGQGWSWLEIGFIILAIKLGLICSHGVHYWCITKKIVKKKLAHARARANIEMKDVTPVVSGVQAVQGVLQIPAL